MNQIGFYGEAWQAVVTVEAIFRLRLQSVETAGADRQQGKQTSCDVTYVYNQSDTELKRYCLKSRR